MKKKSKKGKIVVAVILTVFILGFGFGAYMMTRTVVQAEHEKETFSSLTELIEDTDEVVEETGTLRKYDELYDRNPDFFGWLRIDDTVIDYPVMYTPRDTEYYLHRDFYGEYSDSGMLFIDGDCPADGDYYLIYGHHMNNGSMFGELPKYRDEAYYKSHKTLFFDTRFEQRDYEIFAAFYAKIYPEDEEEGHFCYYNYKDLAAESVFDEYVANVKELSVYETGVTPTYGDELIALSTCNYHTEDGRFVVVARRIRNKET